MPTVRRTMVCTAALRAQLNTAAKQVDTVGGQATFTVPLRAAGDVTDTVVAHWCSWSLDTQLLATLKTLAGVAGLVAAETTERAPGFTATPATLPRLSLYDGAIWAPEQVLAALGLATLTPRP